MIVYITKIYTAWYCYCYISDYDDLIQDQTILVFTTKVIGNFI